MRKALVFVCGGDANLPALVDGGNHCALGALLVLVQPNVTVRERGSGKKFNAFAYRQRCCSKFKTRVFLNRNKTPFNRGTAAIPLLFLSHEQANTHFTPFKWWFV